MDLRRDLAKGKQIVSSSPEPSSRNLSPEMRARECRDYFDRYLNSLKNSREVADDAEAIRASILCYTLKELGMPLDVQDDELQEMLISSGHADADGNMNYDQFVDFATDFKLVESVVDFKRSARETQINSPGIDLIMEAELDGGLVEEFFDFLTPGASEEFSTTDHFVEAFAILEIKLSEVDAESLVLYLKHDQSSHRCTFEKYLDTLRETDVRENQARSRGRTTALDKGQRLHRLMGFVASYITRGRRRRGL